MIATPTMKQEAPYPSALATLVESLQYRPGWRFRLCHYDRGQDSIGLTLIIVTQGYDSYNPENGETYRVQHFMPVPPAAYNEQSWRRWLFDQCLLVERHECCEFFKIDGRRPYAPHHGPGNDPYVVFERGTDEEARTMYTGEVRPAVQRSEAAAEVGRDQAKRALGDDVRGYHADREPQGYETTAQDPPITPRDVLNRMAPRDQAEVRKALDDQKEAAGVKAREDRMTGSGVGEVAVDPGVKSYEGAAVVGDQGKDGASDRLVPRYPVMKD